MEVYKKFQKRCQTDGIRNLELKACPSSKPEGKKEQGPEKQDQDSVGDADRPLFPLKEFF
jgi:hypothetical protein